MVCNKCGYEWRGVMGESCPACGAPSELMAGEDIYARGVTAERETKFKTAMRCYAGAADLGVPCAAYAVCRCMEKSGLRQQKPDLYEFWLFTAARTDAIAAAAYAKYVKRAGDERTWLRYLRQAADMGHDESAMKVAWYYLRHGNRPAARFYLKKESGIAAAVLLFFLGKNKPACEPHTPDLPDNTVELWNIANYALELELPHIAYTYYEEAADASYLPAIEKAAEMCMQGRGCARNEERVQKYLTELGDLGKPEAYVRLGDYYINGALGGEPNPYAAAEMYRRAAEAGRVGAMVQWGDCLLDGSGVERDSRAALTWYDRAAKEGSQVALGRAARVREKAQELFEGGEKLLRTGEFDGAVKQLTRAAEMGYAEADCLLGDCALAGRGMKASAKAAAEHYRSAAMQGNVRGMYRLGTLYMMNEGVRFDARLAEKLLQAAARGGYAQATEKLEALRARKQKYLARKMYAVSCAIYHRGEHAEAARYRAVAAKMGHGRAAYLLGCMYDCGDGVVKDAEKAREYYELARRLGYDGKAAGMMSKYLHRLPRL